MLSFESLYWQDQLSALSVVWKQGYGIIGRIITPVIKAPT